MFRSMSIFDKSVKIRGVEVPRRRFTRWAALYFAVFFCLPLFAVAFVLDYLLYMLLID